MVIDEADFDALVSDALDTIPPDLLAALDNVVVLVEDEPEPDEPDLLGLYEGVPLTERGWDWGVASLPDRIRIFRGPLQRLCTDVEQLRQEIAITVVHELAHHMGIDDETLHDLGWG